MEKLEREQPTQIEGTAIFLTSNPHDAPLALMQNLKHNKVLHETLILLTIQVMNEPTIEEDERIEVQELSENLYRIILRYGFIEEPNLAQDLSACKFDGQHLLEDDTTFFLGRESVVPTPGDGMAIWREHLYAWMKRNAGSAADFYRVPTGKVVELGGQYEI